MTTFDVYRVTLQEFIRRVAVERKELEDNGFPPDQASIFSIVLTEVYYLEIHMMHLRSARYSGKPDLSIERDVYIQDKLTRKRKKLGRYQRCYLTSAKEV